MDLDEQLETLLGTCRWVRSADVARTVLPTLMSDMPPLVPWTDGQLVLPIRVIGELVEAMSQVLQALVEQGLKKAQGAPFADVTQAKLIADPLVRVLARHTLQVSRPGLRAHAIPGIALAWVCPQIFSGQIQDLPGLEPATLNRFAAPLEKLASLEPREQGRVLGNIGWALAARMGAAVSLASRTGTDVRSGGLYRELLPNPLVMAFPQGWLDIGDTGDAALDRVAGMLGLPVDPILVGAMQRAATLAVDLSRARMRKGEGRPVDEALNSALPGGVAASPGGSPLFHPVAGPMLVRALPDLVSEKDLRGGGLKKDICKSLMRRTTVRALASCWTDLIDALLPWDVLSALCARVVPVGPKAPMPGPWSLLVPRPIELETTACVVAVKLGHVERAAMAVQGHGDAVARAVVDAWWRSFCGEQGDDITWTRVADHAVALFADRGDAEAFGRLALVHTGFPCTLPAGWWGAEAVLTGDEVAAVGISDGPVDGATDGVHVELGGPVVHEALAGAGGVGEQLGLDLAGIDRATDPGKVDDDEALPLLGDAGDAGDLGDLADLEDLAGLEDLGELEELDEDLLIVVEPSLDVSDDELLGMIEEPGPAPVIELEEAEPLAPPAEVEGIEELVAAYDAEEQEASTEEVEVPPLDGDLPQLAMGTEGELETTDPGVSTSTEGMASPAWEDLGATPKIAAPMLLESEDSGMKWTQESEAGEEEADFRQSEDSFELNLGAVPDLEPLDPNELLEDFVVLSEGESFTFGRIKGGVLEESQVFQGNRRGAYREFLRNMIVRRFAAGSGVELDLDEGDDPRPLDMKLVHELYAEVIGR